MTVGGGSTVNVTAGVLVTANSSIILQSINTAAQVNGTWQGTGVTLNAASVQVDPGSSINADGQGYRRWLDRRGTTRAIQSVAVMADLAVARQRTDVWLSVSSEPISAPAAGVYNVYAGTGGGAIRTDRNRHLDQ